MSSPISRPAVVGALLKKELKAYSRDKLYLFLTALTLVAIAIMFPFLPDSVDETITLAVSPPIEKLLTEGAQELVETQGATQEQLAGLGQVDLAEQQPGLELLELETSEDLAGVIDGKLEAWRTDAGDVIVRDKAAGDPKPENATRVSPTVGIAFPEGFISDLVNGRSGVTVTVYSDAGVPDEIRSAMEGFGRETAYRLAGRDLPVTMPAEDQIVLGMDRVGDQATLQEKTRPMMIFMVLLMETFSMASLVSTEVLQRTVTAVLVTPAKVGDFLAAKTIFGTMLALTQGLIILLVIGGLTSQNWSLLLTAVLMGAVMFTGVALFVGAAGKDFLGQLFYAMVFLIPMIIPAFSVLFPGTAATWVKIIPTYPIMNVLVGSTIYGSTWADSWGSIGYAGVWLVFLYGAGLVALKRKVESL